MRKPPPLSAKQRQARKTLERHEAWLRGEIEKMKLLRPITTTADIEHMEYVASAIDRYIKGGAKSLDNAFGVKRGRGNLGSKGGQPGKHSDLAWAALPLRMDGYSWKEIARQLNFTGGGKDVGRALEEIVTREMAALKRRWEAETAPEPREPDRRTEEEIEADVHRISRAAFLAERARGK